MRRAKSIVQKRQPLRIALMIVLGAALFLAGFWVSQYFGYAKIARIIEPAAPLMKEALSGMSKQELHETADQMRKKVGEIVQESDLQALFEAMSAKQALSLRERKDDAAAWSYLEQRITAFRQRYESRDMQVGDWRAVADTLYQHTEVKND